MFVGEELRRPILSIVWCEMFIQKKGFFLSLRDGEGKGNVFGCHC
jgi:hypothetical protein